MAQFPNKYLFPLRVLQKCRTVTRNKMEDPTPPNPTLAASVAKKEGGKEEKRKESRKRRND